MLKIKDEVNIEELKRFGFKPKYDEDTGKVIAYQKVNKEIEYEGLIVNIEKIKSKIRIFNRTNKGWLINKYNERFDIDTLYDLVKARISNKGVIDMSADEMFEELGYIKKEITWKEDNKKHFEEYNSNDTQIQFFIEGKYILITNILNMKELEAINEKVKELGWKED